MLQVRQLEKVIDHRTALSIAELDVAPGGVVAVVGPVGSGKTLLIRLLCGEVAPSGGSIVVDGHKLRHACPELRARIGCSSQTACSMSGTQRRARFSSSASYSA